MTADELRAHFNRVFGITRQWPTTYEVDAVTYANCCQDLFNWVMNHKDESPYLKIHPKHTQLGIALGNSKNGLMFKGVELILKS